MRNHGTHKPAINTHTQERATVMVAEEECIYWRWRDVIRRADVRCYRDSGSLPSMCVLIAGLSCVPWYLMHHRCAAPPRLRPGEAINQLSTTRTPHTHTPHCIHGLCAWFIWRFDMSCTSEMLKLRKSSELRCPQCYGKTATVNAMAVHGLSAHLSICASWRILKIKNKRSALQVDEGNDGNKDCLLIS